MAGFCITKRNSKGEITRVNRLDGKESSLYIKIAKHPLVVNTEEALKVYKNIFTEKIENQAKLTQSFFSDVVEGVAAKYKPYRKYEYVLELSTPQKEFKGIYEGRTGEFDKHIATSIPTFRDIQVKKGAAIVETLGEKGGLVYDLGGSEGTFVKAITESSGGKIKTINLDPNLEMIQSHNDTPIEGSTAIQEAFFEGFDGINKHVPLEKADVVHESMLFQFITPKRKGFVEEVVNQYIKEDGLFITEEKFKSNTEEYTENEVFKDKNHKSKYYTQEQIQAKGDSVLVGMKENQVELGEYLELLNSKFKYVSTYWSAGNFRGIVATNSKSKHDKFIKALGSTTSIYSNVEYSAEVQVREHNKNGGSTFSVTGRNLMGTKNYSVSIFPDKSKVVKKLTTKILDKYIKDNKDILKGNESLLNVGTWLDTKTGDIYMDIATTLPLEQATQLGKDYNQKAIFNLEIGEDLDIGGTGIAPTNIKSVENRILDIKEILKALPSVAIIEDEVIFSHKLGNGEIVGSYKQALIKSDEGDNIELGFIVNSEFTSLMSTKKNTNKNTEQGYANSLVEAGLLSEDKTKVGLEYRFKAGGETELMQIINTEVIRDDVGAYLGTTATTIDGFTFQFEKTRGLKPILTYWGEAQFVEKEELDKKSYQELQNEYDNALDIITQREWEDAKVPYRDRDVTEADTAPTQTDEELQLRLLNFLQKLGVTTMSIAEYVKKYKTRNGVHPSAKALADIANQVVAYVEGDVESLSEEVAHFINEALPQDKVENILRNIHKTAEWNEFSDQYREIYSKEHSGAELENIVRREVLGKIVAKVVSGQKISENKSEIEMNIFDRVADAINNFFTSLRNIFKPEYSVELNQYLDEVERLLSTEDITDLVNTSNFKYNKLRLYNVGNTNSTVDKLRKTASLLVFRLRDTAKTLIGTGSGSRSNLRELERIQERLDTAVQVESITSLLSMVNSDTRAIKAAIKDSKTNNKSYFLSDEEGVVFMSLKNVTSKAIGEVKVLLTEIKKDTNTSEWDIILEEIDTAILDIKSLEAEITLIDSKNVERIVNRVMDKYGVAEQDRELITKWIDKAESDTNLFHSTFGQLVHAKDGLLNVAGGLIKDMTNFAYNKMFPATKRYQDKLKEAGVTAAEISKHFVDDGFILSEYRWGDFYKDIDINYVGAYRRAIQETIDNPPTGETTERIEALKNLVKLSDEELVVLKNTKKLEELSLREETSQKNKERPEKVKLIERTMKDEYYDTYNNNLKSAGVSDITIQKLSDIISDISAFKKKAFRKEGDRTILDYDSLSEHDKGRLEDIYKDRKMLKSYVTETGILKKGLKYLRIDEVIQVDEHNQNIVVVGDRSMLSEEAIVALDLNNLDNTFPEETEKSAQFFYDTLTKIDSEQGRESALKFLRANSFMSLSQEFWGNLKTGGDLVSRLTKKLEESPELGTEIKPLLSNIRTGAFEIKNIIKLYSNKNNPSEVNVELMSIQPKEAIKQLQRNLKTDILQAKKLLGAPEIKEGEDEGFLAGVSEVNDSYKKELKDSKIFENEGDSEGEALIKVNQEIDFAKKHMSLENANLTETNRLSIHNYLMGNNTRVNTSIDYVLENLGYEVEDLQSQAIQAEVLRAITRARLLPYYKRFTSESYNEFTEGLETTEDLSKYLQNSSQIKSAFVEIRPNYSFFEQEENDSLNPAYRNDFKGGYLQPKLSKYRNNKFDEKFGTIVEDAEGNKTSSKNPQLYRAYEATLEYNDAQLEAMNAGENYNNFLLPQIRRNDLERFTTLIGKGTVNNVKNFVKDAMNFTEDDMIQGDTTFGEDVKVIPKMYINKLEDPEDVSTELFYSLTLRAKEAYNREAKVRYFGDLMSIQDKIGSREMNGKSPETSNAYKMISSAIDYNLFGIKETVTYPINTPFGKIDLVKMARTLLGYIKFRNLGLNIVIPITSLLTGEVTRRIEIFVGEFIDRKSQNAGRKEYRKLAAKGIGEIGDINPEAKLNVMGQFFKTMDLTNSFVNSNYNKFLRNFPKLAMFLHTTANYPIYGKTMVGILHDFRIIDGKLMNRNEYLRLKRTQKVNTSEAKRTWEAASDKIIYDYLIHDKNNMSFNKEALGKVLTKEGETLTDKELDEAITDIYDKTQKYIQHVNSLIDGQIPEEDRVLAQRHFLLSYFMTHRGWLSIAIARRFKNKHLNLDTNVVEEGAYRSVWNFIGRFGKEWRNNNFTKLAASYREAKNQDNETEARNRRRVGIDTAVLATLMILSLGIRMAADDDENEDFFALQLTNYLTYRTLSELSSVQLNISSNIGEVVADPFVGWNTITNLSPANMIDVFSGDEVKHGSYKGMTERRRYLTKMVPGMKQYFDLQNMHQTYDTYKFYNKPNFNLTPINLLWQNTIDKKKN